jgi:hypothetical protein
MHLRAVTLAGLVLCTLATSKPAEVLWAPPGELRAVVLDRDSVPLRGVTVSLFASGVAAAVHQPAVTTGGDGVARFANLPAGEYVIRVELSGFAPTSIGPVTVRSPSQENPRLPEFLVVLNPIQWVN